MKQLLFLFLALTAVSCTPYKHTEHENLVSLENNLTAINGRYKNDMPDSMITPKYTRRVPGLWKVLTKKEIDYSNDYADYMDKLDSAGDNTMYVELTALNEKRIRAQLFIGDKAVDEKILKGRLKDGYFSVRHRIRYFGIPVIFMTYSDYKLRLGVDTGNILLADIETTGFGWIFIMSAGSTDVHNFVYGRKE